MIMNGQQLNDILIEFYMQARSKRNAVAPVFFSIKFKHFRTAK